MISIFPHQMVAPQKFHTPTPSSLGVCHNIAVGGNPKIDYGVPQAPYFLGKCLFIRIVGNLPAEAEQL